MIFDDISVRRFVCNFSDGTRAEDVFRAEQLLGVFVYLSLHLTREVQVNIGRFITVEAKKGLEHI